MEYPFSKSMSHSLVISAVGEDRPGIVDSLSKLILDNGANIVDSRMLGLGGEFAVILMIIGDDEAIAAVETALTKLEQELNLKLIVKRTVARRVPEGTSSCHVEVVALDHPGIVYSLANFFSTRQINIDNLHTDCYSAAHTGTPMFSLEMDITIPDDTPFGELRDQFIVYCEQLNLDAKMEQGHESN